MVRCFKLFPCVLLVQLCGLAVGLDLKHYRERVRQLFQHAYNGYLNHAYPLDELRPLTCDGHDTWGSFSLTLVDAADTLIVMGNFSEFRRITEILLNNLDPKKDINISVFETNIRIIGGLLSAHLFSKKAGLEVEPGWPCSGPLLNLAEKFASKLLDAFNSTTGMPYGTVNLKSGRVPFNETSITCTAGVATFLLEFGTISRLTGNTRYETVALKALQALWKHRSFIGLIGNHVDVANGKWTSKDAGIGAGVDSYFEYLVKGAMLFQLPELHEMYEELKAQIDRLLKHDDWYFWANMDSGSVTLPIFQSLEAFWPSILVLSGNVEEARRVLLNYIEVWKQYGFLPEMYNVQYRRTIVKRSSYPLRPELIESIYYVYRATKDPSLLRVAIEILDNIENIAKTRCGVATVANVEKHSLENRMESFFLAETVKYLYLLFDTDNFLHNTGDSFIIQRGTYGDCILYAGGYVFNTEAHPIDPGAIYCCSEMRNDFDIMAALTAGSRKEHRRLKADMKDSSIAQTGNSKQHKERTSKVPWLTCPVVSPQSLLSHHGVVFD